jgi:hypothetical protein
MLATVLFAIAAQDQPATMTLETPALNAQAIVQLVADATQRKIAASPDMVRDVLVIKVKNADVQGVLDRIATVTFGKWVDKEGVSTLVPDAAARKAATDQAFVDSIKQIEKTFVAWETPPPDDSDGDWGELSKDEIKNIMAMRQVELQSQKAFVQLLRGIGARRIASLGLGERIVYSDQPNPAQVRLNGPWNVFYNVIKQRMDNNPTDVSDVDIQDGIPPDLAEFMNLQRAMAEQTKPFDGVPVKFLLAIQRAGNSGMYGASQNSPTATLYAMDKNGSTTYVNNVSFDGYSQMIGEEGIEVPAAAATTGGGGGTVETEEQEPQKPGRPIKFTPEEAEIGTGMYGTAMPEKVAARLKASFTDQTKDPLDLIGGTILRRIGDAGDLDVVANVPDSIASLRYLLAKEYQQSATIELFLQNFQFGGVLATEENGWLSLAPSDYVQYQQTRMDRPTLSAYAASIQSGAPLRLDVMAEFMYRNPLAASNSLFQVLRELTPTANMWMANENVAILRFWGSLSDAQRRTLRNGQPLALRGLSKASKDLLAYYVYGTELPLSMPPPAALSNYSLPARSMLGMLMFGGGMGGGRGSWVSEPTESLPQGLPGDGVVSLESWSEVCFVPDSSAINPMIPGVLGATEMIMLDAFKLAAPSEAQEVMNAMPTKATVGTRTNLSMTIGFTPQVQAMGQLCDIEIGADKRVVSLLSLPPDLKESVNATRKEVAMLEAFMKYMVGSMGDGEGGQRPPP